MRKENGIALVTTLIIGLVSLMFISTIFYLILKSTETSTGTKIYTSALEAAKGTSDHIMNLALNNSLKCKDTSTNSYCNRCLNNNDCSACETNPANCELDISDIQVRIANFQVKSFLITKKALAGSASIYSFQVQAIESDTGKKSIIEFVYKVQDK